jgi:hypothetical protein
MFRQIQKCLLENHQVLSSFTGNPKTSFKAGFNGFFGISNYEFQNYVTLMKDLYCTGRGVFKTYRLMNGKIVSTSIDIATILMFLGYDDQAISVVKSNITGFCELNPGLSPKRLDLNMTLNDSHTELTVNFVVYSEEPNEFKEMGFQINTTKHDWVNRLGQRTAFDLAFDDPLLVAYAVLVFTDTAKPKEALAINLNTALSKNTCKSIAACFIANMTLKASGNDKPDSRIILEITDPIMNRTGIKSRFTIVMEEPEFEGKPKLELYAEYCNKAGSTSAYNIIKTNSGLNSKGNPGIMTANFKFPASLDKVEDEKLRPAHALRLGHSSKEILDRVFEVPHVRSLTMDTALTYGYWRTYEDHTAECIVTQLINLQTGECCVESKYSVYEDAVKVVKSSELAVIPPPVIYLDESENWLQTKEYQQLFMLVNKLLNLGIRTIWFEETHGNDICMPNAFIDFYCNLSKVNVRSGYTNARRVVFEFTNERYAKAYVN